MKTRFSIRDIIWLFVILYGIIGIIYRFLAPQRLLSLQQALYRIFRTRRSIAQNDHFPSRKNNS
ncbi:MAG: hypothetical protein QM687_11730 [Ferruginibacter sp.]